MKIAIKFSKNVEKQKTQNWRAAKCQVIFMLAILLPTLSSASILCFTWIIVSFRHTCRSIIDVNVRVYEVNTMLLHLKKK